MFGTTFLRLQNAPESNRRQVLTHFDQCEFCLVSTRQVMEARRFLTGLFNPQTGMIIGDRDLDAIEAKALEPKQKPPAHPRD